MPETKDAGVTFDFAGRVAVVAGASSGIGLATARLLADSGAQTVCLSRTGRSLPDASGTNVDIGCDISRESDVAAAVDAVTSRFGRIDALVVAAAANHPTKFQQMSLDEWRRVLDVNLTGTFLLCRGFVPLMRGGGSIVLISSIAGRWRSALSGIHYVTSKAGLLGFTRQLAYELGPAGIRVNALCPSQTETPMLMKALEGVDRGPILAGIPLRRFATPEEQARVTAFLVSDASSYMTGALIDVNGGQI